MELSVDGEDLGADLPHLYVAVVALGPSELAASVAAVLGGRRAGLLAGKRSAGGVLAASRMPDRLVVMMEVLVASPSDKEGVKALALALATSNVVLVVAASEPEHSPAAPSPPPPPPPQPGQVLGMAISLLPAEHQLPRIAYLFPGPDPPHPFPHPGVLRLPNVPIIPSLPGAPETMAELLGRENLIEECLAGDAVGRIFEAVLGSNSEEDRIARPMLAVKDWSRSIRAQFEGIERAAMVKK